MFHSRLSTLLLGTEVQPPVGDMHVQTCERCSRLMSWSRLGACMMPVPGWPSKWPSCFR